MGCCSDHKGKEPGKSRALFRWNERISKRQSEQYYIQPPETFITCAVTYFDSSEARYSAM